MSRICGVHHVSLKVMPERFQDTLKFYQEVLGLETVRLQDGAAFLSCGNVILEILNTGEGGQAAGALNHFAFEVDDVEGMIEKVRKAGRPVTTEPKDHLFTGKTPYPVHIGFFEGPAGEAVEFFKEIK